MLHSEFQFHVLDPNFTSSEKLMTENSADDRTDCKDWHIRCALLTVAFCAVGWLYTP